MFLIPLAGTALAQQAGTSPVKIYIMAGQSNMLGKGTVAGETTPGTLDFTVANDPDGRYQFLKSGGSYVVRDDVWIRDQDPNYGGLTVGYGGEAAGLIGPELGFGHKIGDVNDAKVLIVKCAWGGRDLGFNFCPPSSRVGEPEPTNSSMKGFYYKEILRLVNEAKASISTYVPTYSGEGMVIAGMCWHQGWNDRIDTAKSAAYETNMANFINDIRNDLTAPNMPFVIATTGMDGYDGYGYTQVEKAQLKMADAAAYPAFAGNVAVVDARATYEDLDFWQPIPESPADEGYHWNRNAKTYLHLGLAMGDAMSLLSSGRCPFRPRASGAAGGVTLTWQNGTETPTSVRVLRNGIEIAAAAPAGTGSFLDAGAPLGVNTYELQFTMPVDPCDPLTLTHNTGITDLAASLRINGIKLTWRNNLGYASIQVKRDNVVIAGPLPAETTSYTDHSPPAGLVTYTVEPTDLGTSPAEVQVNVSGAPRGTAVVYEPFDMPDGETLRDQPGGIGIDGTWAAGTANVLTSGSFTFGTLPTYGNRIVRTSGNGSCSINLGTTLADAGLLDHGAELWFSFLCPNPDNINVSPILVLGNETLSNSTTVAQAGDAIGARLNQGKTLQALVFSGGGAADTSATQTTLASSELALIVGHITWGANSTAADTIEVYSPGTDLVLDTPQSASGVVDQSTFKVLSMWGNGTAPNIDEIRFGATYEDVIGQGIDTSDDLTPPSPAVMSFSIPPTALTDASITMTAANATDANDVQYKFVCTSGGGHDSPWQNSPVYTDTGLSASTEYFYTVQARDKSINQNTNTASLAASATTNTADTNAPPTPGFASSPMPVSATEITMTATTVADPDGADVEYRFHNTTLDTYSTWQSGTTFIDSGLTPSTQYFYTVQARDTASIPNESAPSAAQSATTFGPTNGTWGFDASGNWGDSTKWAGDTIAVGQGATATFPNIFSATRSITVEAPFTIGNLTYEDTNTQLDIIGANALNFDVVSGVPAITVTTHRLSMNCPITGGDGLAKEGNGYLNLGSSSATYAGTTHVNAGILDFGAFNVANIGGGGRDIDVASGAAVRRNALDNPFLNRIVENSNEFTVMSGNTGNNIDFSSSTGANLPNAFLGNWAGNGAKMTFTGTITPASDAYRLGGRGSSGLLGISGTNILTGSQGLIVGSTGGSGIRVNLAGAQDFTGETVINSGARLTLGNNLALQNSALNVGSSGGNFSCAAGTNGGRISGETASPTPTFGGLKGSRNLLSVFSSSGGNNESNLASTAVTGITLNPFTGVNCEYSGVIANFAAGTTLTKTGPGTQVFTGVHTYTGATTIDAGALLVNSPGSLHASSAVIVNGGTLGGMGTINGPVTVNAAGGIAPGASAGTLTIGGPLDLTGMTVGPGVLAFELDALAGTNDRIDVGGTLSIGTGSLGMSDFSFTNLGGLENGTYTLITSSGISGTLDGSNLTGPIGNGTGTLQINGSSLQLAVSGISAGSPYDVWSGGAPFNGDANGDGVKNGLAFLLGAAGPSENATDRLPTFSEIGGGLVMTFNCRPVGSRGTATLRVEHSSDLGISDVWLAADVPDTTGGPVNEVSFVVGAGPVGPPALNSVTATIGSGEAADGKLFGRLKATEN